MTDARFRRAAELFLRARALGVRERTEMLESECDGDRGLRDEVERLLAGDQRDLPFAELAEGLGGPTTLTGASRIAPDSDIGPYRLREKIGEGGFGVVYLAEQVEPVRRRVAIKVLRAGMDSRQVVARFEAERQALAMMDHPNITRVFDAGATPNGRPYFVMELVRGVPITTYCDTNRLGTRERIELLLPVCHAVHHAHQKGIIHRDLKPSNVLVTLHDGVPVPKVIDFGIAKALSGRLTEHTLYTEHRQLLGTPEYMSPEQAEMSGLDIDTRADIYSLGVMLYELLTSTTPLDAQTLRAVAYAEVQRIIRDVEPPAPSRRLQALARPATATTVTASAPPGLAAADVATRRGTIPTALRRELSGELDWIAMKCLEKDRTRRYETANDLLLDLRRYLSHEPVLAGPPSTWYRLRKGARRHRGVLGAATAVVVALTIGLFASLHFMLQAQQQRDLASAEMTRATTTADVLRDLLRTAGPVRVRGPGYTVAAMLDDFSTGLEARLSGTPSIEVAIRMLIGGAFVGVADFAQASLHLERALAVAKSLPDAEREREAEAGEALALLQLDVGRYDQAAQLLERALQLRRALPGEQRPALVKSLGDLAMARLHAGRPADAIATAQEAMRAAEKLGREGTETGGALRALGEALAASGRFDEAEPYQRRAIAIHRQEGSPSLLLNGLAGLAVSQLHRGEKTEATRLLDEALALRAHLDSARPQEVFAALHNLAIALSETGRLREAEQLYREGLTRATAVVGEDHISVARGKMNLAALVIKRGEVDEARRLYESAIALLQARGDGDRLEVANAMGNLGALRAEQGDLDAAAPLFDQALAIRRRLLGDRDPQVAYAWDNVGQLAAMRGEMDTARAAFRNAIEILRATDGEDGPETRKVEARLRQIDGN